MYAARRILFAVFFLCSRLAIGQETASTVQGDWVFPAQPDLNAVNATLTNGETYTLRWTNHLWAWFNQYAVTAVVTDVDLYFAAVDDDTEDSYLVQKGVNVNTTTSLRWTVSVPDSEVAIYSRWSFRFVPAGRSGASDEQISSPQVILNAAVTTTSASSVSTITTAASSATSFSSLTTTTTSANAASTSGSSSSSSAGSAGASSSPSSTPVSTSTGLSAGAKAGIAIGAVAAVALLGLLGFFLLRNRRRNQHVPIGQSSPPPSNAMYPLEPKASHNMQNFGGYYKDNPAQQQSYPTQEMSGSTPQYAELEGTQHSRPPVNELGDGYRR